MNMEALTSNSFTSTSLKKLLSMATDAKLEQLLQDTLKMPLLWFLAFSGSTDDKVFKDKKRIQELGMRCNGILPLEAGGELIQFNNSKNNV